MWTKPKNIVKTGFPYQPYKNGQKIASVYVIISYETGLPLYSSYAEKRQSSLVIASFNIE